MLKDKFPLSIGGFRYALRTAWNISGSTSYGRPTPPQAWRCRGPREGRHDSDRISWISHSLA